MRSIRRLVLAFVIGCLSVLGPSSSVLAAEDWGMIDFSCTPWTSWQGSIHPVIYGQTAADRTRGTLRHCLEVWKEPDSNSSFNLFRVRMIDEWNVTFDDQFPDNHAHGYISVSPGATDWRATNDMTSSQPCN